MRIAVFTVIACLLALVDAAPLRAQGEGPVRYFYDDLGRVTKIVDPNGNVATYNYDAVGNLVSITRSSLPANNGLAIISFSPQQGPVGTLVTVQGQGFSTTASDDAVQFSGTPATVTGATATSLTVNVPAGAATGPLSVTVSSTTATSDKNFTVTTLPVVSVVLTPRSSVISSGGAQQFAATASFQNGTTQDVTSSASWSSSNTAIATVNSSTGLASSVGAGLATISAAYQNLTGLASLKIVSLTTVSVAPSAASALPGTTQQFTAVAQFSDGTVSEVDTSALWSSSNPGVATVTNTGLASTLANGSTTITATYGGMTASGVLNVRTLSSVSVAPANASLAKGTNQQFTASANYTDGTSSDITRLVSWSSSNSSTARISNIPGSQGFVTTVAAGTVTITATYGSANASTSLTVTPPAATSLAIIPDNLLLPPGGTLQAQATAKFTDGTTSDVTSSVAWNSSNTSVATISSQGLVTGVQTGTTTVTATLGSLNISASTSVVSSQIYQGYVYAADGQTPVPSQYVQIYDTASGSLLGSASTDADGFYQTTGNAPGSQGLTVQATMECSGKAISAVGTANGGQPITVNLTLPLAIVQGSATFYDGTPVADADILLTADQTCYGDAAFITIAHADANGNYVAMPELTVSPFTVYAQDGPSGLMAGTGAAVTSLSSPVTVNVNLPPTGTVTGSVFDSSGNPLTQGGVDLYSSITEYEKNFAISGGNSYGFSQVPVGTFVVTASPTAELSNTQGAAVGALATGGQQVSLNVSLQPTSSVAGTVFASDGVTAVPSATVAVENPALGGGIADYYNRFSADANGNFSLANIPVGPIRVAVTAPDDSTSGITAGTLSQSGSLTINPTLGNAFTLDPFSTVRYNLDDSNGFVFDLDCVGEPEAGAGLSYSGGAFPYINGGYVPYDCELGDAALIDQAGRQLTFGPRPLAGDLATASQSAIQAGRKVFVPTNGGFARYLEILTNPLNTPVTVTFEVDSYLASIDTALAVDPSTTGQTFAVVVSPSKPNFETLGYVFGGGAPVRTTSGLSLWQAAFTYKWAVTIPANQTIILMHFLIQRSPGDVAGATSQAQALVNLSDPAALTGMTDQEKAEVVNFNVQ